jgi:hypothetical protein
MIVLEPVVKASFVGVIETEMLLALDFHDRHTAVTV